jgi:hypothetical protein
VTKAKSGAKKFAAKKRPTARKAAPKPAAKPAPKLKVRKGGKVPDGRTPSQMIDQRIRDAGGWRGEMLARLRALLLAAKPAMTEEWRWGVPVWSRHGIVCAGEVYTKVVKLTFMNGAKVPDPQRLFNSSMEGATRRAIDFAEGATVDARAFQTLVKAAVATNAAAAKR